jgi:large subunit ribosomal protein L25
MPEITLIAEIGRPTGSRASSRLRHEGKIPAVIYGHGTDPLAITVDARSFRAALSGDAGLNALLNLDLAGKATLAMAKDIQRHPVRGTVSHVDFLIVNRDEVITADIPIVLVGEAEALHRADGTVEQALFNLTIHAKADAIPNSIEVDISDLLVGDSIRVDDLDLPAGSTTDIDGETAVVIGQPPQMGEEAAAEGEAAEGETAEGEAGAAAEGDGDAAGDSSADSSE